MGLFWMTLAVVLAYVAALAFYPALRLGRTGRTLAWLSLSSAIALSPCLIPLTSRPLRLLPSLVAILLLVKLLTVVFIGRTSAAAYRLLGGTALDPTNNPLAAKTPAEFWRRWNRPAQQFLQEYAFKPSGGLRRPVVATFATFAVSGLVHEYVFGVATGRVQGWQLTFFMLQGCAAVATQRIRPASWAAPLWVIGTAAFNLLTAVLFFRGVDAVLPFYSLRS